MKYNEILQVLILRNEKDIEDRKALGLAFDIQMHILNYLRLLASLQERKHLQAVINFLQQETHLCKSEILQELYFLGLAD